MQEIFNTVSELNNTNPRTKEECISFFEKSKQTLKIIDSHNTQSIIVIFKTSLDTYALKVECGANTATHKERDWFRAAGTSSLATYYAGSYVYGSFACIVMQYLSDLYPISELFLSRAISLKQGIAFIDEAFQEDVALFKTHSGEVSTSEQFKQVKEKYLSRFDETNNFPYLKQLFIQEKIKINDRVYDSPAALLEVIENNPKLTSALLSTRVGLIHGDLHLGNINIKKDAIVLLDPKSIEPLPLEYDGGKLLQSTHSKYVQIMLNEFTLKTLNDAAYELEVTADPVFEGVYIHLRNTWSEEFLNRSLFMEAMHFITMAPHHASNENEAIALYLTGVIRLSEVVQKVLR